MTPRREVDMRDSSTPEMVSQPGQIADRDAGLSVPMLLHDQ